MGSVSAARLRLYTRLKIVKKNFPSLNAPRAKVSDHGSGQKRRPIRLHAPRQEAGSLVHDAMVLYPSGDR